MERPTKSTAKRRSATNGCQVWRDVNFPPPRLIQGRFAGQDMHTRFCARLASRTYDCVHRHAARAAVTHEACNFAKTPSALSQGARPRNRLARPPRGGCRSRSWGVARPGHCLSSRAWAVCPLSSIPGPSTSPPASTSSQTHSLTSFARPSTCSTRMAVGASTLRSSGT